MTQSRWVRWGTTENSRWRGWRATSSCGGGGEGDNELEKGWPHTQAIPSIRAIIDDVCPHKK